jgi:CRP-like cAMP-binding protein
MKTKANCTNTQWVGRSKCAVCDVRNIVLFAGLSNEELDDILQPIDNLHASAGAILYQHGSPGRSLFTVRHGLVKLSIDLPNGGYRIVRMLGPGDVAGLEALLGEPYHHTAVVLRDADLCRIPREVVGQLDQTNPKVHHQLLMRWQGAVDQADQLIASLTSGSAEERLARLLVDMGCEGERDPVAMLSREDMGALLGVTTETASRVMAEFKRRGLVREERGLCVYCDHRGLKAIAGA